MAKRLLTGLVVASLVSCGLNSMRSGTSGSAPDAASAPLAPGGVTFVEIARALDVGHTVDQTTYRVTGDPDAADFRVQTQLRLARASKKRTRKVDWEIRSKGPVRATPAAYGASFTVGTNTDLLAFASDMAAVGAVTGVTTGDVSNGCGTTGGTPCGSADEFVISNLYSTTTPQMAGWGGVTGHKFELTSLAFGFNPAQIQVYSLADVGATSTILCLQLPKAPTGGAGYATAVNNATKCAGWASTNAISVGTSKVTWSAPFPSYDSSGNVTSFYYGDDAGRLQCISLQTAPPSVCADGVGLGPYGVIATATAGAPIAASTAKLGPPTVIRISNSPVENVVFVGDDAGNFYRVVDIQGTGGSLTTSTYSLGTTAAFAIHGAPALDYTNGNVYLAAGGNLYTFPLSSTATWRPAALGSGSVALFAGATGPIDGSPSLDSVANGGGNYVYLATINALFKVPYGASGLGPSVYSEGLHDAVSAPYPLDAQTVAVASEPLGYPLAWNGAIYVGTGSGAATNGAIEEYSGCTASAAAPILSAASTGGPYGELIETGFIIDNAAKNLYFGFDTGAGAGGVVSYPLPTTGSAAWGCPAGTTSNATRACGAPGCAPPAGSCYGDSDCTGTPGTPACNTTTHACVVCTATNLSLCVGATVACDVASGDPQVNTCVTCTTNASCTNPATPFCDTSADAQEYTCVACVNAASCTSPALPACDLNADAEAHTCVACAASSDCTNPANPTCDTNADAREYTCVPCIKAANCTNPALPACDTSSDAAQYTCVACTTSAKCTNPALSVCDTKAGDTQQYTCVACTSTVGGSCTNPALSACDVNADPDQYTCVQCTNDSFCAAPTPRCEKTSAEPALEYSCQQCNGAGQSGCPTGQLCNQAVGLLFDTCAARKACTTDAQCTVLGEPHCDTTAGSPLAGFCVRCTVATECAAPTAVCVTGSAEYANPNYEACVQCDAANPSCAIGACDVTPGDATLDQCL